MNSRRACHHRHWPSSSSVADATANQAMSEAGGDVSVDPGAGGAVHVVSDASHLDSPSMLLCLLS